MSAIPATPDWPQLRIAISDTNGEVSLGGAPARPIDGTDLDDVREAALKAAIGLVSHYGSPVRAIAVEPSGTFHFILTPHGETFELPKRRRRHRGRHP